jgi:serine/threonine-protein kinase
MGSVYRVEHTHMRKKLALKVLHREMTSQTEIVARFEREAMAAAHIEHPNVAAATDFGKLEDGSCYLVLEYVEGPSLRSQIDKGPLFPPRAIHITLQILAALRRAHELGIVHRDLKPENVLLVDKESDPDFVKVLDFGIARVPIGSIGGEAGPSLTRAGMVYGTPEYMAPEQALGQDVDGRSDVYAVGVMLFEMLTGRRPYDNKDKVALLGQHVAGPIPSLRERAPQQPITPELETIVARMLAKSPSDRFPDAAAATEALFSLGTESPPQSSFAQETSGHYPVSAPAQGMRGPASSFEVAETMPPPKASARGLPANRLVAPLAGFAALLLVLVVVFAVRKPGVEDDSKSDTKSTQTKTPATTSASAPSVLSEGGKAKAQSALGRVTSGEVEAGTKELEALAADYPNDRFILEALAQAYGKGKRYLDAMTTAKKLLAAHPDASSAILPVFDDALASGNAQAIDAAFAILEGPMKAEGAKYLYAIGYEGKGPTHLAARARKALADPEVSKQSPASIRGVIELKNASFSCMAKHDVIEKYKDDFDTTALPALKQLTVRTGCGGFFKRGDCWPCLREDNFLNKVIQGIEDRSKK